MNLFRRPPKGSPVNGQLGCVFVLIGGIWFAAIFLAAAFHGPGWLTPLVMIAGPVTWLIVGVIIRMRSPH